VGSHARDQSARSRRTAGGDVSSGPADMFASDAIPFLTRHDRCDRCRAAAHVRALLPDGNDLLFCQHHARQHASRLREIGALLSPEP
jgi:hypothetical protein